MNFFLNEHSLHGQFRSFKEFKITLANVLDARKSIEEAGFRFYSDTKIRERGVIGEIIFHQTIVTCGDKAMQSMVLSWLSKTGPFWKGEQTHSAEDLFSCMDDDVTGGSLAEAACRHNGVTPCGIFGFTPSKFCQTPLSVNWWRNGGEGVDVLLGNFWGVAALEEYLATLTPIEDWQGLLKWARKECKNLLFSDEVIEPLLSEPFSFAASEEIQNLLLILDDLSDSHDASGALNEHGLELHKTHFQGHHTRFSDETANEKFNFNYPGTKNSVQCSWHGKVRLGLQYRIHFEWPKPAKAKLWVAYIGPKLTKW